MTRACRPYKPEFPRLPNSRRNGRSPRTMPFSFGSLGPVMTCDNGHRALNLCGDAQTSPQMFFLTITEGFSDMAFGDGVTGFKIGQRPRHP